MSFPTSHSAPVIAVTLLRRSSGHIVLNKNKQGDVLVYIAGQSWINVLYLTIRQYVVDFLVNHDPQLKIHRICERKFVPNSAGSSQKLRGVLTVYEEFRRIKGSELARDRSRLSLRFLGRRGRRRRR